MMTLDEIRDLALSKFTEHNLVGWKFEFDRSKTRYGQCRHSDRTISMSYYISPTQAPEDVLDTILHEMAHALVGGGHGHDEVWKAKCVEIGARPIRCGASHTDNDEVLAFSKYYLSCACGTKHPVQTISPTILSGKKLRSKKCGHIVELYHNSGILVNLEQERNERRYNAAKQATNKLFKPSIAAQQRKFTL